MSSGKEIITLICVVYYKMTDDLIITIQNNKNRQLNSMFFSR